MGPSGPTVKGPLGQTAIILKKVLPRLSRGAATPAAGGKPMEPTIGRIVMFRARQEIRGQTTIAAMITAIEPEGTVTLTGFPPGGGTPSHEKVPQGDADTPYSWYWPAGSSGAGGDFFGSGGGA